MTFLQTFFADPVGIAVEAVAVVALVEFILGTLAALRDGTFTLDELAAWLRKHLAGRVFPIFTLLFLGYFGHVDALTAVGLAAAASYIAETIASVISSLQSIVQGATLNALVNPPPTD